MVGTTGLICIPTAQVIPNGKIAVGMAYTDAEYSRYGPDYSQIAYYATIGYLPFLEASLRVTEFPNLGRLNYHSQKDRMVSVKLRVIDESHYIPSLVLGIHDIFGNRSIIYNAQYFVISKMIKFPLIGSMRIHTGYSPNPIKSNKIKSYSMKGAFAGIEKELSKYLTVILEYDTQKYNAGLKIAPLGDRVNIDIVLLGFDRISGGMNVSFDL